jgi:hypothetical protein
MAGREAQRFAEVAFLGRDFDKAYESLSESGRQFGSAEQFKEFIIKKHPTAFPSFVNTTDYEPVPGQSKINVYLYGENGTEKFYYRMIMEGSQDSGYKVLGFDRKDSPYPQTNLRNPLK